jgi:hypothetical protein
METVARPTAQRIIPNPDRARLHRAEVIDAFELPVGIADREQRHGGAKLAVVHVPQAFGAGGLVVPEDVLEAILVEVTHTAHDPLAIQEGWQFGHLIRQINRAIELPNHHFLGRDVAPENIGGTIAGEVANAEDFPLQIDGGQVDCPIVGQPLHLPDAVIAGAGVAPEDIGGAIAIEVANPFHLPATFADVWWGDDGADIVATLHFPESGVAGAGVVPEQVSVAVPIEVPTAADFPAAVAHCWPRNDADRLTFA